MPSRTEITRILRDEVNRSRHAYQDAQAEFNAIAVDIPSGLPSPDGALRITNAAASYRTLMAKYRRVRDELNAYLKDGIIPDRLKNSCQQCAGLTREMKSREREYEMVLGCVAAVGETEVVVFQKFETRLSDARMEFELARLTLEKHQQDSHAGG